MTNFTKFATGSLLLLGSLLASEETSAGPSVSCLYDQAMAQLAAGNLPQALDTIDAIDSAHPTALERAETLNLRGAILIRQCDYEGAEYFLRAAIAIEPKLWNAHFNLAEIPFLEKNWLEARRRFQEMLSLEAGELDSQTCRLIRYKILFTRLLEGKAAELDRATGEMESLGDDLALCYLRAAIARERGHSAEAAQWIAHAQEQYPESLNRLYAESFSEVGWGTKQPNESRERFAIGSAGESDGRLQTEAKADLARAEAAFLAHDDGAALRSLDAVDFRLPHQAASHNLRAEILMAQDALNEAETELLEALAADPNLREASYNLAEIAFRQGRYREARDRFEKLFAATPEADNQPAQLIKFKIFLTFLLEGRDDCAQPLMTRFRFTGVTPALYYAEAAWDFQHGQPETGAGWIESAQKIYSPALNLIFADSFYRLGWVEGKGNEESAGIRSVLDDDAFPPSISVTLANRFSSPEDPSPDAQGWGLDLLLPK